MNRPPDAKLLALALRASQTLELDEFLGHCAEGIGELLSADSVHAYFRVTAGEGLELRHSWPDRKRESRRPPALLDEGLLKAAEGTGQLSDGQKLRPGGIAWAGLSAGVALLLPLGEGVEACGLLLTLAPARRSDFSRAEVDSARAFLGIVAPALKNVRLVADLRETAVRDDIAGCYNRRHFETFLGEEIARAKRFRSRVSILFLDMDNLKSVNTTFGHAMGSRSLQEVSGRVAGGIRKIDKLFRFGGDEFCVVLPETDTQGAYEVAERTRETIASAPLLVPEVGGVHLSASLGVATFPDHGSTSQALVQAADRAMQEIKKSGKNAIGIARDLAEKDEMDRPSAERKKGTL